MMDKTSLERSKSKAEKHKVKAQDETNIKPGILRHATEPVRSRNRSANPRTGTPEHHKKHRSASEHRRHHEHENPEDEKNCDKCQRRRLKRAREALKMGHAKPKSKEKEKEKKKTKPPTTNPRLFKLSLTDPAHMPPKCCTNDHIPLKHVEKLLSDQTKQLWNKKYKEFTTKNRIYCPVPNCGEWIPPEAIHKKIGKCSKCKTKVCAMCNAKAHGKEECPKDPELLKFLDAAHENKYQRCYNCKRFVELDKGCNHMTCPW
ncbi:hypothetical protein EX30DRAFT_7773 [Ascodesmis nigricans]|uniref:IBR domain-containing protein n=1 Tax=Ascodesmis nigricans TaxID=341454 RepID=A0A4S2N6I0_9PEZI|nr:hypothetical protein EX30DRAFT_7773 [Ascodesmis nigricans]